MIAGSRRARVSGETISDETVTDERTPTFHRIITTNQSELSYKMTLFFNYINILTNCT